MDAPARARQALDRWREDALDDWLVDDPHLRSLLAESGEGVEALQDYARAVAALDPLVRENNRDENLPRLRRFDGLGHRIEAVDHHPSHAAIGRVAWSGGMMGLIARGQERAAYARMYLFAQHGEGGHACPMACTAGLIKILQRAADPRPDWLERLTDPDYDRQMRAAQFLTEVQGGSDVGANGVVARPDGDGWRLFGEKWFCSVIDAHLFLVTARPEGGVGGTAGLRGYVVPRTLDDGSTNRFFVRRLKYKLGTRSMASAEVDFDGALAVDIGDFRAVLEQVIDTSRLGNAVCCSALLQRAQREAHAYARRREAFGKPILAFPSVARRVAELRVEAYAARGLSFTLAALSERIGAGQASERDQRAFRMALNLNKIWTSDRCTHGIRGAIEVLGGNGAIEEFSVLPRLLRDAVVLEAWEGGHNVLCSQILRDCQRLGLHEDLFAWLLELGADPERLGWHAARWRGLLTSADAAWHVRDLVDALRPVAQAGALAAQARVPGSDPLLPTVIAHLAATSAPGWDPLADDGLLSRVSALVASDRPSGR